MAASAPTQTPAAPPAPAAILAPTVTPAAAAPVELDGQLVQSRRGSPGGMTPSSTKSSFAASPDSNGDGVGDLNGLIQKLDYLNDGDPATTTDLGVTGLWLMPIAESPSYHGYDVSDYSQVDQEYGTNADFKRLIAEAHRPQHPRDSGSGAQPYIEPAPVVHGLARPHLNEARLVHLVEKAALGRAGTGAQTAGITATSGRACLT